MPGAQWWVIQRGPGSVGRGGGPTYSITQSVGQPHLTMGQTVAAGPFNTRAEAQSWINGHTGLPQPPPLPTFTNPLAGLAAVGDFFNRLTQKATWIRAGEITVGLIALAVGLYVLTKDTGPGKAYRSARKEFVGAVTGGSVAKSAGRSVRTSLKPPKPPASAKPKLPKPPTGEQIVKRRSANLKSGVYL